MRKILALLCFVSTVVFGQTYPSPTYNNLTVNGTATIPHAAITGGTVTGLSSPLPVASGGTGASTLAGLVTPADISSIAANTILANATGSPASPTALTVPSCSTSASALNWTSASGFTCNTSVNAAQLGGATFAAPGPIGSATPGTGAFTTLSTTGLFTMAPVAGTNAFSVTQTAPATFSGTGPLQLNSMSITAPVNDTSATDSRVMGLYSDMEVGGASSKANAGFYNGFFFMGVKANSPNITGNVAALVGGAFANSSTGVGSGLFGANPYAICASGCVFSDIVGLEADVELDAGATTTRRVGIRAVNQGATSLGSGYDAAYAIDSTNSGGNFLHALYFANEYGGGFPIQSGGDLMAAQTSGTIANGINLPNLTMTGNILNFNHFVVSGAGIMTLTMITSASIPACAAGTNGGVAYVSDATSNAYGAVYTGGGAVRAMIHCNGSNWVAFSQ